MALSLPPSLPPSLVLSLLFLCLFQGAASEGVGEGHFRYGSLYWRKTDDPLSNTVEIVVESAWRRSFSSQYFTEAFDNGETVLQINGAVPPSVSLGDGTTRYLDKVQLTALSESEDWILGHQVIAHTYQTPNHRGAPWKVSFTGCCRISGGANRHDGSWRLEAGIDLLLSLSSPRLVSLPVVFLQASPSDTQESISSVPLRITGAIEGTRTEFELLSNDTVTSLAVEAGGLTQLLVDPTRLSIPEGEYGLWHVPLMAYTKDSSGSVVVSVSAEILLNISAHNQRPVMDEDSLLLFSAPVQLAAGFARVLTLRGAQIHGSTQFVGFTLGVMPPGMTASTVRGRGMGVDDMAEIELRWTPCTTDIGSHVVCVDLVNSEGLAATQRCLSLSVVPDMGPSLSVRLGEEEIPEGGTPSQPLYIGRRYHFVVSAVDSNPLDALSLAADSLPPDGVLLPPSSLSSPSSLSTSRELVFAPKHNHGGYNSQHCFTATDSCGDTSACNLPCEGGEDSVSFCVSFKVTRCAYTVRDGEELSQIASIYHSDWLQLWSHNDHLLNPDDNLQPGTLLHIGRAYDLQPYDTVEELGRRFGMTAAALHTLNADLPSLTGGDGSTPVCTSLKHCQELGGGAPYQLCVLPSSCTGEGGTIYA